MEIGLISETETGGGAVSVSVSGDCCPLFESSDKTADLSLGTAIFASSSLITFSFSVSFLVVSSSCCKMDFFKFLLLLCF